jgi:flagellar basal body-associated protein FliL
MPVERFTEEEGEDRAQESDAPSAEDRNTSRTRWWLTRLVFAAGGTAGLAGILLACFLLTGVLGRPNAGVAAHDGVLVALEEQTVNLAEPGTRLDVRIVFEASSPEFAALLRRRTAQLADIAIAVISTKTPGQLDSDLERNRLKRELADAVGQHVRSDEAHITNVYFTQFYYE